MHKLVAGNFAFGAFLASSQTLGKQLEPVASIRITN